MARSDYGGDEGEERALKGMRRGGGEGGEMRVYVEGGEE